MREILTILISKLDMEALINPLIVLEVLAVAVFGRFPCSETRKVRWEHSLLFRTQNPAAPVRSERRPAFEHS